MFVTPTQPGLLSPHLSPSSKWSPPCPRATSIPLPTGKPPRLSYSCYPWLVLKKENQSYDWNNTYLLPRPNAPTDFQVFKKGRAPQRWEKMGSKTWQPALQFGQISYHSPILLVCLYFHFPQHHRYRHLGLSKQLNYFHKSQVKLRALQSSSHTILLQRSWMSTSLVLHLSPQNKLSFLSLSLLQWFGLLAHAGLTTSLTVTNQQDHTVNSIISPPAQDPGFKLCVCCGCIRLKCTRFLKKQKEKKPQKIWFYQ